MSLRFLVLTLVAIGAFSQDSQAIAQIPTVALSLNLRYHDPADPSEGGRWFLMAKTTADAGNLGLGALDVYLANITTTGIVFGNNGVTSNHPTNRGYNAVTAVEIGAEVTTPDGGPFAGLVDDFAHITYAQDNSPGAPTPLKLDVGHGSGTPGYIALDPLRGTTSFGQTLNTTWNNAALIASGTFPGGGDVSNQFNRPAFATPASATPSASALASATLGTPFLPAGLATSVRGDSIVDLGLSTPSDAGFRRGDRDRDFVIDGNDLTGMLLYFNQSGKSWDDGDVTDGLPGHVEGKIDGNDLNEVLLRFNTGSKGPTDTAPLPLAAVPEPTSVALASLLPVLVVLTRRRNR
jgi:hypothetical protein